MANKKRYRPRRVRLVVRLTKETLEKVEVLARRRQTSVNEMVAAIVVGYIGEDTA